MTGGVQGIEHRARVSAALTLAAYADSTVHEPHRHALSQIFTLATHLANRRGDLDEDDLADDLVTAGWDQHEGVPTVGTQRTLELIGSGVGWWRATRAHNNGRGSYGSDAAVRATAAGLVPGAPLVGVAQLARRSSMITHCHPDARDAAAVQACAMALAGTEPGIAHLDAEKYHAVLSTQCHGKVMARQLALACRLAKDQATPAEAAAVLGDSATAPAAAAAALAGFLRHPGQPLGVIAWVQAMGTPWHASAVMAAALAGTACPQARPPLTWRVPTRLQAEIAAIAAALASASAAPGRRRLTRGGGCHTTVMVLGDPRHTSWGA